MNTNNVEGFFQAIFQDSVIIFSKSIQEKVFPWKKIILTLAHSYLSWFYYFSQGFGGGLSFLWFCFCFFGANCVQDPQVGANILSGGNFKNIFLLFGVAGSIYWYLFLVLNLFWW